MGSTGSLPMHMNQLQQQSPRLASVVCAALSTGTSLVEEEEGDNTRRKADAAPLKRSSKQLKASIGGVKVRSSSRLPSPSLAPPHEEKVSMPLPPPADLTRTPLAQRDVGTKGVDPCEEYLRLLESAEVGEIVELLESAKAQGVTEQLASVIRYKQFFDVCRQHKPVPLKEAMLFVRLCGLRDKRMYTELARLCGDADRVQEAFQLVSEALASTRRFTQAHLALSSVSLREERFGSSNPPRLSRAATVRSRRGCARWG
jgi:hypothetical protein